jgi:SAM-dependent methyltransferase
VREGSSSTAITFRGNLSRNRHGWLRLTPAYSVELVERLVLALPRRSRVLDPFCGSGTTLLTCAERGLSCTTVDLNPFLIWLANAKAARYEPRDCERALRLIGRMARAAEAVAESDPLVPPIANVERWWDTPTQLALGCAFTILQRSRGSAPARTLATLAFCRTLIGCARVSFGHQSMSFSTKSGSNAAAVSSSLEAAALTLDQTARAELRRPQTRAILGDARHLSRAVTRRRFDAVVTSPPYCNRMSYIRELRPYMYWLGHLDLPSSAGELDWQAIGGTWGVATSRLNHWQPTGPALDDSREFSSIVRAIQNRSELLSRYVHRYFSDMREHLQSLWQVLSPGAKLHYVIGNSKFYDVLLPTERLLAQQLREAGFVEVALETLRTRTSKTELYEFLVTATKPA